MSKNIVYFVEAIDSDINVEKHMGKLSKKSTAFTNYASGASGVDTLEGGILSTYDKLEEAKQSGLSLVVVKLDAANFEKGMEAIVEANDRHSFMMVNAKNALVFAGAAANKASAEQSRACSNADVAPTLCYMFGYPVPENCTGSVLYQALKNPNMPHDAIAKLQDVIDHLEAAVERDSRAPWDKHDCA